MSTHTSQKIDQKEYLKKYLSGDKVKRKKKDKKHKRHKDPPGGIKVKIIDDDLIDMDNGVKIDEELLLTGDDAPQIVGEYTEDIHNVVKNIPKWKSIVIKDEDDDEDRGSPPLKEEDLWGRKASEIKIKQEDTIKREKLSPDTSPTRKKGKKKRSKHSPSNSPPTKRDKSPSRRKRSVSPNRSPRRNRSPDQSPPRQSSNRSRGRSRSVGNSPPRMSKFSENGQRKSSPERKEVKRERQMSPDQSPPRKGRLSPDQSPPRRRKGGSQSPSRRRRNSSDQSPPRRKDRGTPDPSPPRRRGRRSPDQSPPRRRRDSDQSPPRKNKSSYKNDCAKRQSPPRRRRDSDQSPERCRRDSDQSPPRKTRNKSPARRRRNSDQSPPRRGRRPPDQSPLRRRRSPDQSPTRKDKSRRESPFARNIKREKTSMSPQRQRKIKNKSPSPPPQQQRKSRWEQPESRYSTSPPPTHKPKVTKTLDGKKAGLQDAQALKTESLDRRKQEDLLFEKMSSDLSGRHAEVRVRNTGRMGRRAREAREEDPEERRRKEEREQKRKEHYERLGKGLKQLEDYKNRKAEMEYEASKPLARHANDEDLERFLKEQERAEDPMLEYMRQKRKDKEKHSNEPKKPVYEGPYPENRFAIRPGYRWDGVDRSNGYEKKWFDKQNERKARQDEAYQYSVEDM